MQIFYCETCGMRIGEEDLVSGQARMQSENTALCGTCLTKAPPAPPAATSTQPVSTAQVAAISTQRAAVVRSTRAVKTRIHQEPAGAKATNAVLPKALLGLCGVLAIAIVGVALSGRKNPESQAAPKTEAIVKIEPPKSETKTLPQQEKQQQQNTTVAKSAKEPEPPKRVETVEDYREGYASRRWAELKTSVKANPDWESTMKLREFARTYASTASGKEAAAMLNSQMGANAATAANTIAGYRRDFKTAQPATGWRFLWNADGAIGKAAHYKALVWHAPRNQYSGDVNKFPCDKPLHFTNAGTHRVHPGPGVDQGEPFDRFMIAAYTLQPGQKGNFGLSVLAKQGAGENGSIEVRVYVNDTFKGRSLGANEALVGPLGALQPGDTVYVALGPNRNDGNDTSDYDFSLFKLD